MPLVRVEVRNEYRLGMPELYTETDRGDPKAVLDGVAVAGLVGVLRQLGDLAEFAAEVFHGLQEQMLITSSRSHKLVERVHNIESALPTLEKAILAQRSHLHFAYTAGSLWHTRFRIEQNHFIYSDLPRCIRDSYEDCRDPPRLHKLDKFDTGGPGSCFKRFSDPTCFQRASTGSYEAHFQSARRGKKARRSKKKRSLSRYGDVKQDAPILMHGGSMDFSSSNFNGLTAPSQHISKIHDPPRSGTESEMGDHLISFDSRSGSGYKNCIFRPSYSTQSEENKAMKPSSELKVQHNDYVDSASIDENTGVPNENIQNSYVEEQSQQSSSYATWDEKLEITAGQPNDTRLTSCTKDKLDTKEKEDLNYRAVGGVDFAFHEGLPTPVIVRRQTDEIGTETDYYMDALNTIEPESETDVDCQTKKDLKQYPNFDKQDVEEKHKSGHLDENSVDFEFCGTEYSSSSKAMSRTSRKSISSESHMEPCSSSNNETSEDKTKSNQVANSDQLTSRQMAGISSIPFTLPDNISFQKSEIPGNLLTVASYGSFSSSREPNSQPPPSEQILSTYETPEAPSSISGAHTDLIHPTIFWTNGGLLGLEPSKPPDFGLPTAVRSNSVAKTKDDVTQHLRQKNIIEDDGHGAREDMVRSSSISESFSKYPGSSSLNLSQGNDCNAWSTMTSGTDGPVTKHNPIKAGKENNISSCQIFEFSNRLLVNGFRRQISLVGDEKLAGSLRSGISEKTSVHKGYQSVMGRLLSDGNGYPLTSPSSPPLEHMRITFQPIDGFETSTLKLKFSDGSNCPESHGDMFPSFQLVPEPDISLHESGSDSDDDTFCGSPYASDDYNGRHSKSNSEKWDSSDSPRSNDHQLDDAFGRISSAESISSSRVNAIRFQQDFPDHGNSGLHSLSTVDDMEPFHSGRILDFPGFYSLHALCNQPIRNSDRKYFLESCSPKESTPPPPPLPPLEWRGSKLHTDVAIEKEDSVSKALTYALDPRLPEPMVSQQPKPDLLKQDHFVETMGHMPRRKPNLQNLDVQNEPYSITRKVIAGKETFLQQIRTKSYNLRPTSTTRATSTPDGPSNFEAAAILEKANAVRQAVGGDDDNWSDT